MSAAVCGVIVIGRAPVSALATNGAPRVLTLPPDATATVFDEATHTWTVAHHEHAYHARIVVDGSVRPPHCSLRPYLGVADHGRPNYFMVGTSDAAAQWRYITECLEAMARTGATRIEVRYSSQRLFNERDTGTTRFSASHWRQLRKLVESAFDLSSLADVDHDVYDGAATLGIGEHKYLVRARLTGHIDPIDGRFHWQGTVYGSLPDDILRRTGPVELTIAAAPARAQITERTPWGSYSVSGVGTPPFGLQPVELTWSAV